MNKNEPFSLVETFHTAREEILCAARENFQYVYDNGGYSLEKLAGIFRKTIPIIKWDKSVVRRFLNPDEARAEGTSVALKSATPLQLTLFLESSIHYRDIIQLQLQKAHDVMARSRAAWADFQKSAVDRAPLIQTIRDQLLYVHQQGGISVGRLSAVMNRTCPAYSWKGSTVHHFILQTGGDPNLSKASADMIVETLKQTTELQRQVMSALQGAVPLIAPERK